MKKILLAAVAATIMTIILTGTCFAEECQHEWGEWKVGHNATCGEDGYKERWCSLCWDRQEETIPATGKHVWDEWYVDEDPECFQDGSKYRYCEVCNEKQEETVPAIGHHTWSEWKITDKPSCGYKGEEERECSICDAYQTRPVAKTTTHTYYYDLYEETLKEPTPFRTGILAHYCDCYTEYKSEILPKLKPFIKLGKTRLTIKTGKTAKVQIKKKAYGDPIKKCTSSNKKVAAVNKKGKITAKKKGKATITVILKSGVKAKCKVTVK